MAISLTLFYGSPNAHNGAAASLGSIARASQKLNAIALSQFRVSLTAVLFLTSLAPCGAEPAPAIHYAPAENLEHSDVALIDGARHEIDWNREISLRNNRRSFGASHSWIRLLDGALIDATPPGPRPHRGLPFAHLARGGSR
jgi:hypothetical protein